MEIGIRLHDTIEGTLEERAEEEVLSFSGSFPEGL